jgi:hypothetical protein
MWHTEPLSSPPARSLVRRRTAEAEWFERLQGDTPLTRSMRSAPASPVHVNGGCAAADLDVFTKPLRIALTSATIELPATKEQEVVLSSPLKERIKILSTPTSSRKRKRSQDDDLSSPSRSKQSKTRLPRESTLIPNPIDSATILPKQLGSRRTLVPANPTAYLPTPSPESSLLKKPNSRSLPLHLLIEYSFLLVYRPIYPIIRRPKGKPALNTLLPAERLLNTLEALLIGCGWLPRRTPVPKGIERGIVFVDTSDGQTVANLIQTLRNKQGLKSQSTDASQAKEILVVSKGYLDYFYSYSGGRTIDGRDVKVEFIWTSES